MMQPKFLIKNKFQKRDKLYEEILTPEILSDISFKLTGSKEYLCEFDNSGYNKGRLAVLEFQGKTFYISFSEEKIEGRNSSFQSFSTALTQYLLETNDKKEICFYFLPNISGNFETPYFAFNYRLMKTANVRFINSDNYLKDKVLPFVSPEDIILLKDKIRSKNRANKSTYITKGADDKLQIFGKTYGASKYETTNLCLALSQIIESDVELYEIEEGGLTKLPVKSKEAIESLGKIKIFTSNKTIERDNFKKNNSLRSPGYIYNLLEKLGDKKCAFCDCAVPQIIQGAHIWPVSDIKKDHKLDQDEKLTHALSGDNGLWLCQNHHKLFDTNTLTVSEEGLIRYRNNLDSSTYEYMQGITTRKHISGTIINDIFLFYLSKRNNKLKESEFVNL